LDVTKAEENKMTLENTEFELHRVLEDSLEVASSKQAVDLVLDVKGSLPSKFDAVPEITSLATVVGDAMRLRQILGNLLSNAIKFSLGREVILSASCKESNSSLCELLFSVRDRGIGISGWLELHQNVLMTNEQRMQDHISSCLSAKQTLR
jgi:signal transduction histidine kinase